MSPIINLNEFNLTTNSLKKVKMPIAVRIFFKSLSVNTLKKYTPQERKKRDEAHRQKTLTQIAKQCPDAYTIIGSKQDPVGIEINLNASTLLSLSKDTRIHSICIEKIKGKKPSAPQSSHKSIQYCAKVHFVIQVEGKKKGMQTHEHRYILVQANNEKEAIKKIHKEKKRYEHVYLNDSYELVRWKLFEVEDVVEVFEDKNDVIEVYSELFDKRISKETVWV